MYRIAFVLGVAIFTGCAKDVNSPAVANEDGQSVLQPSRINRFANFAAEGVTGFRFSERSGAVTIEGVLKGCWLRQQSGETLGDWSKATIFDPIRLVVGDQSLPLLGGNKELEQTLLENSGKRVHLTGDLMRWIENGRGTQSSQAGYTGAMPAHVVEFLTVSKCEVIVK